MGNILNIEIYSDGSAQTAATAGGWGSVILFNGELNKELSGYIDFATNNDAELAGSLGGLKYVWEFLNQCRDLTNYQVTLISDSEIILGWASGKYKFKQTDKLEKYEQLQFFVKEMDVKTKWVKGHSGNIWNERCDKLANNARLGVTTENLDKLTPKMDTKIGTKQKHTASLWYNGKLKVLDFETGIIENYDREAHGKRGSVVEIREGKAR